MAATTHRDACKGSACLCDGLFNGLSEKIPNLVRLRKRGPCAIGPHDQRMFAYIYHLKTRDEVTVWCRGDLPRLQRLIPTEVKSRRSKSKVWEDFSATFKVRNPDEVANAVRCLFEESYPPVGGAVVTSPDLL